MKKLLLFVLLTINFAAFSQQWAWARQASLTNGKQDAEDVCSDYMGNVFIIGNNEDTAFYGNVMLDSGSFVAKYSSSGALLWAKKLAGDAKKIACDGSGNVYVVGNFSTSIILGTSILSTNGQSDFYIAKINSSGNTFSAVSYGGPTNDEVASIAIDNSDNIFITGSFHDSISVGNNKLKCNATNSYSGNKLMYLIKISSGNVVWATTCPYNYANNPYQYHTPIYLKVDKNGSAYITGQYDVFLGCQMYCFGYFIVKYNPAGTLMLNNRKWDVYEQPFGLAVDDSLNILVEYNCGTHYTFCRTLAKYDSQLNVKWSTFLGDYSYGTNYTFIYGLSVDNQCNIYIAGLLGGQGTPGDTVLLCNDTLTGNGATDILVGKFNPAGNCKWAVTAGGPSEENFLGYKNTMYVDNNGNCYLTGIFNSSNWSPAVQNEIVYFGNDSLQSDGNWQQVYLAKINSQNSTPTAVRTSTLVNSAGIRIFPNPSSGVFSVRTESLKSVQTLRVYDLPGNCLLTTIITEVVSQLDLRTFPKGIYFLEIETEKGKIVKKIILQ